ncbi:AAA family ATPase [uncultured Sulfitobacter sp.]|uniref:AAA family ATPase n=1 Tax=uncultured Sulfitobacter sp. TaxID=191468 RepID=UPI0030D89EDF
MTELLNQSPLFPSAFSADLARSTIAALRESALSEWKSNAERLYEYGDEEADGEASVDLLQPSVRQVFENDVKRSPDGFEGPPAAETMTSAKIERCFAAGDDPWSCADLEVSPLWEINPRPAAVLGTILMCAMVEDEQALAKIFRPGCITLILCPSGQMRSQLESVATEVLSHWQGRPPRPSSQQAAHHAYDGGSSILVEDRKRSVPKFRQAIDKTLMRHVPVVAICGAKSQLSPEQESLVHQTFRWLGISPAAVIEVLRCTHSNTRHLAEDELLRRLPDAAALRRLEPLQIAAAFEETTTLRVADRLSQITSAQRTGFSITLDDVQGLGAAVRPLEQMLSDLKDWRQGRAAWSEVTRSVLMFGPPGTGKTMLAHAIAGSAGVPIIATSYSSCQRHGHQGDMLAALSAAFERAAQQAPAVLFIDEIDSFSNRSEKSSSHEYLRGIVNGLLEQINRAADVEGLILIGATNHIDIVDPAVIRSGRFDVKLEIPLPNRSGLEAILAAKLESRSNPGLNLRAIADRLLGEPGATAEAIARDALGRARADREALAQRHLEAAVDAIAPPLDPGLLHRIAVHEAGHLLAALLSPLPTPVRAWVTARGGHVEPAYLPMLTLTLAEAKLRMCLAGRAAEILVLDEVSNGAGIGQTSDLAQATMLAAQMQLNWSFGDAGLAWQDANQMNFQMLPIRTQRRIEAHLQAADAAVRTVLKENLHTLKSIAAELIHKRELTQVDLKNLSKRLSSGSRNEGARAPSEYHFTGS